jgi:hypothetical protein
MKKRSFTIRVGPLAMSLAAAALTAIALAAIAVAESGGGDDGDTRSFRAPAPPGAAGVMLFHDDMSDADRQKLEDFRRCMEDNGAPTPPEPGEIDPSEWPPKPPSAEDREKLRAAWESCQDKLPEDLRSAGPPELHLRDCGPDDASPGTEKRGGNENQSNDSGDSSTGSAS